jgi:hypothetical protein
MGSDAAYLSEIMKHLNYKPIDNKEFTGVGVMGTKFRKDIELTRKMGTFKIQHRGSYLSGMTFENFAQLRFYNFFQNNISFQPQDNFASIR